MKRAKVFGIGFHKTGTSSLARALGMLGYRSIHGDGRKSKHGGDAGVSMLRQIKAGDYELPSFAVYDAFTDNPYFSIWQQLAEKFPDAKFVLTERDEEGWLKSCVRYYDGRRIRPMREWMFGEHADPSSSDAAAQVWLAAYRNHNRAIKEYFANQPDRLLVINVMAGDGWQKLCPFLAAAVPAKPFPHANRTKPKTLGGRLARGLRKLFP